MSAFDIIRQLEEDRRQLAHYQKLVDELQQRIRTAERELAHAQPVITDETASDSHMSFREAMEFITGTVFSPVIRITDGLVIECTCEDGEFSSYSTGYVRDPDSARVVWYGSGCFDTAPYRLLLQCYDGITDSIFVRPPPTRPAIRNRGGRPVRLQDCRIGQAGASIGLSNRTANRIAT